MFTTIAKHKMQIMHKNDKTNSMNTRCVYVATKLTSTYLRVHYININYSLYAYCFKSFLLQCHSVYLICTINVHVQNFMDSCRLQILCMQFK